MYIVRKILTLSLVLLYLAGLLYAADILHHCNDEAEKTAADQYSGYQKKACCKDDLHELKAKARRQTAKAVFRTSRTFSETFGIVSTPGRLESFFLTPRAKYDYNHSIRARKISILALYCIFRI